MAPHEFAIDGLTCQRWQVKRKGDPDGSPLCLVIFRHQNRCRGAICLGDEPEFDATSGVIHGPKPRAFDERTLVGCVAIRVHVAPISRLMSLDAREDVLLRQSVEGVRRGYDLAKPEFGNRPGCCAQVTPPATMS